MCEKEYKINKFTYEKCDFADCVGKSIIRKKGNKRLFL